MQIALAQSFTNFLCDHLIQLFQMKNAWKIEKKSCLE